MKTCRSAGLHAEVVRRRSIVVRSFLTRSLQIAAALFGATFVAGCGRTECGLGTIEQDGVCIAALSDGGNFSTVSCDLTHSKLEGGRCVPKLPPIVCETGQLAIDDAGVGHCTAPASTGCAQDLPCTAPSGDEICISGRVVPGDHHDQSIDATTAAEIEVRLYEPINFLSNTAAAPFQTLSLGSGLDECGRYRTRFSTSSTPNQLVAVATYGRAGTSGATRYVLGAAAANTQAGQNIEHRLTFLVPATLNTAWSQSAALPSGQTFASLGTLAVRYHTQPADPAVSIPGTPVAGVTPQWNGVTSANNDYFFSDSGAGLENIDGARSTTGPNGTAFLPIGSALGNVTAQTGSGSCLLPSGAQGSLSVTGPPLAGSAAGVIFFFNLAVSCQ